MGGPGPLIKKLLTSYRRTLGHQGHPVEEFRYVHAARKVVGVGSVGTRCYLLLLSGRDQNDPLFLQVKEAQASVLEPYAGPSPYPHHGQRVVMGQRLMQAATDIFLGWPAKSRASTDSPAITTCGRQLRTPDGPNRRVAPGRQGPQGQRLGSHD